MSDLDKGNEVVVELGTCLKMSGSQMISVQPDKRKEDFFLYELLFPLLHRSKI